jgi:hypothetical protein
MTQRASYLTNFATAAAVGIATAFSSPAQAETPLPPLGNVITPFKDSGLEIKKTVNAAIQSLGGHVRNAQLHGGKDNLEALKSHVRSLQGHLNENGNINGRLPYEKPLKVDGHFGPATAEAIIRYAEKQNIEEVFIHVPSQTISEEVNSRFLRNKLEALAPLPYLEATRSFAENKRESLATNNFHACLDQSEAISYSRQFLTSEEEKLRTGMDYISSSIPTNCVRDLKELRIGTRINAQLNYIFNTLSPRAIEKPDICYRKIQPEFSSFPKCIEHNI